VVDDSPEGSAEAAVADLNDPRVTYLGVALLEPS
jgi:hypothetical protein